MEPWMINMLGSNAGGSHDLHMLGSNVGGPHDVEVAETQYGSPQEEQEYREAALGEVHGPEYGKLAEVKPTFLSASVAKNTAVQRRRRGGEGGAADEAARHRVPDRLPCCDRRWRRGRGGRDLLQALALGAVPVPPQAPVRALALRLLRRHRVLLGIAALVLALTVFKVRDPVLTMNGVTLEGVDGDLGTATAAHPVSVNATLTADVSIENPNAASFRFRRSETDFYYAGETVGVAYAPRGEVGAGRTVRMNVTLDVLADRISPNVNATDLIFGQDYNLTSYTEIAGRVSVLGIYKRDLDIKMNCSITLELGAFTTVQSKSTTCVANVS
ncbi:uncharacterized protein C2845_PM07G22220 [Panicum miliaceum]|uniref:Late embryogenesis abundant protein LEA-2 subgroup domain-containing protein n=1 Tax=Panicum miliaceum TaxID=4540 RepID=A0A3L6SP43_PANMI|nr:uncharacterized protein C2845_PM07G22220 [Panicum miliaceum]